MKALIFNSGLGRRMGHMTEETHKSLAVLSDGETILERQIRLLSECGIKEFVITTGPFADQLKTVCAKYPELTFRFVANDIYFKTNYIYSFYLTKEYLDDDFLTLHGDLVFNKKLVKAVLENPAPSVGLINKTLPKPEKDFKARVIDGYVKEVGINIFEDNCYAFQPLYKLAKKDLLAWWARVADFINSGNDRVYAENALNEITDSVLIKAMRYDNYFIEEIDNEEDYARVTAGIREFDFDEQEQYDSPEILKTLKKPLVVAGSMKDFFKGYKTFSGYTANPKYEEVMEGLKAFEGCDSIISVGGGSAIDVAKAIKYYSCLDGNGKFVYKNIKHVAVPTTAGAGSESTRYAVIYKDGEKLSITHDALFPDAVVFCPELIKTLPLYQKKCALLDALCHAIESIWSVYATEKSVAYAQSAIELIKENAAAYISGDEGIIPAVQKAANLAGKAINVSRTTASHALAYKLTTRYGLPHGYAVALTVPYFWKLLAENGYAPLGKENITLSEFEKLLDVMELSDKTDIPVSDLPVLTGAVNTERLKNFPLPLTEEQIKGAYLYISR